MDDHGQTHGRVGREREREREGERETGPLRGRNVNTRPQTKQSRRDASNLAPRPRRYT